MIKVDLTVEAAAEVERLTKARDLAAGAGPFLPDGPLIAIARRSAVRRALCRRVLVLWRSVYEDAGGRLAESALVAATIARPADGVDVRHADWISAACFAVVHDRCQPWRESVLHNVRQFASTRLAREQAIAAAHAAAAHTFQRGLFDRRADRAHVARSTAAAALSEQLAVRIKAVASAGTIALRTPELMLVLVPRDAARV